MAHNPVPRKLHGYFLAFTGLFAALVLIGFSRRFFVPLAQGTYDKPLVVHVHALLFFGWTALIVVQAWLAAIGRIGSHRALGSAARWLIAPMLVLGTVVVVRDTVHDYYTGDGEAALSFFYGELADLLMFGVLATAAMMNRHRPEVHKRLVLLGSLGLLGAAYGRIPELEGTFPPVFIGFVLSVAAYDLFSRRALHPATVCGGLFLFAVNFTQEAIGNSACWLAVAHHILRV